MKRNKANNQRVVDLSFDIVLLLKSLFALGEVLGGIFLFFITPERMSGIVGWFTRGELKEDPSDFIAHLLLNLGHHFTVSTQYLAAIYLLVHGLIKLVTLLLLWKKILWAYPLSILVFLGFIIYQMIEYSQHHSNFMLFVSVFDVLLIVLTYLEYKNMKKASSR
ncbi:DUF2127 domain-containing protein [Lactococcus petauri]|uniref:DUF2127 domain-containing protein n=1 Tax=Lactococcus petauri TaxID=1940789 RepID=A0AAJ2IXS0_9LACT|nr:DUF2127 domain-containing protein [Lactococcus petauri]MDT2584531.1 DUF2127 domain-containing protein [Lactococcus petauri]